MVITETWLHENIPNIAAELASCYQAGPTPDSSQTRWGGVCVCVYANNSWFTDAAVIERHCWLDTEFLMLECSPSYLPRQFSAVFITPVYISADDTASFAVCAALNPNTYTRMLIVNCVSTFNSINPNRQLNSCRHSVFSVCGSRTF